MNRELCIARLFTALVIATAMLPLEAGAAGLRSTGPLVEAFNCSSGFAATGRCGVSLIGSGGESFAIAGSQNGSTPGLRGRAIDLVPAGAQHVGLNLNYRTAVNVQQFSTTFTYVPNGWNVAFILSNCTNSACGAGAPRDFYAGAGCEGSFFQGFTGGQAPPNFTFALELDQASNLLASNQQGPGGGVGTSGRRFYSSVQYYATGQAPPNAPNPPGQSPCTPDLGGGGPGQGWTYVGVNKISTSPVPLNNPSTTVNTTTGHTYSVTITYDGSNLTINLYDVTNGGSCPGASCFTYTWANVNIPSIVGGNTAWVGLGGGTNDSVPNPLLINTWSYGTVLP